MLLQVILNQDLQQTTLCIAEHDLHNEFSVILSLPLKKEISNSFIQNFIAYDEFNFSYLDDEYFWLENISITKNILSLLNAADFIELTIKDLEYIDQIALQNNIEINEFENLGYQSPIKTIPRDLSSKPKHLDKFISIGDKSPKLLHTYFYFENNDISFIINKRNINSYQFFHHLNSNFDRIRFKTSLTNPFIDDNKLIKFITSLDYYVENNNLNHITNESEETLNINYDNYSKNFIEHSNNEYIVDNTLHENDLNNNINNPQILDESLHNNEISLSNNENTIFTNNVDEELVNNENIFFEKDNIHQISPISFVLSFSIENDKIIIEKELENKKFDDDIKSLEDRFYDFFNEESSEEEFFLEPIKNITDEDIKEQIREFQKNNPVELKNKKDILKNIKKINIENKPEPISLTEEILPIDDVVNYINDVVDESVKLERNNIHNISLHDFIISSKIKNPIDESFLNEWTEILLEDEIDKIDDNVLNEVNEEVSIFENIVPIIKDNIIFNNNSDENKELFLVKSNSCFVYYIDFISSCILSHTLNLEKKSIIDIYHFIQSYEIINETIESIASNDENTYDEIINETIESTISNDKNTSDETINEIIENTISNDENTLFSLEEEQQKLINFALNNDIDGIKNIYKNHFKNKKHLIDFNYYGDNPLCISSFKENIDLVKVLIEQGWNPNYFDSNLNNALIIAAAEGHKHIVKYLLTQKVQVNFKNKKGYTALHFAVNDCNHRIVKLLLDAGSDVNAQDNDKNTPLSIAAFKGDINSTKLLLKTHINVHLKNKQGYDARSIAIISKNNAIAKLIEEKIVNDKNNVNLPPIIEKNV